MPRVALEQAARRRHHEGPDQPVRFGELERPLDVGLGGLRVAEEIARGCVEQECLDEQQRQGLGRALKDGSDGVNRGLDVPIGEVRVSERCSRHARVPLLLGQPGQGRLGGGPVAQLQLRLCQEPARRGRHQLRGDDERLDLCGGAERGGCLLRPAASGVEPPPRQVEQLPGRGLQLRAHHVPGTLEPALRVIESALPHVHRPQRDECGTGDAVGAPAVRLRDRDRLQGACTCLAVANGARPPRPGGRGTAPRGRAVPPGGLARAPARGAALPPRTGSTTARRCRDASARPRGHRRPARPGRPRAPRPRATALR